MTPSTLPHRRSRLRFVLCYMTAAVPLALLPAVEAQEAASTTRPSEDQVYRATVEVTATTPDLIPLTVIENEAIEQKGASDLIEALRYESGMAATRRGAINLDPSVRGLFETQVASFVDGTRTFAAGPGRMDSEVSHVSLHAVEEVTVVKGPYALVWGSGAMSAIDIRTFQPSYSDTGPRIEGRAGALWTDNVDASDAWGQVYGSTERARYNLFANYRSGGDYQDGGGNTVQADYESADARWSLGWATTANSTLDYEGGYQDQNDIDYAGRQLDATYFKTRSHKLGWLWSGQRGLLDVFEASVYSNDKTHLMNNDNKPTAMDMPGRMPPFGLEIRLPTESDTKGGKVSADLSSNDRWRFKVGGDAYDLYQSARRTISRRSNGMLVSEDIVWPDATMKNGGVFAQALRSSNRFELGATVRVDRVDVTAGEVSEFFAGLYPGDLDNSETNTSFAASVNTRLSDHWSLNGGVGRAVRTASILERYSDRFPSSRFQVAAEFVGSPYMEPEASQEVTLGVVGGLGRFTLRADSFYRIIDNYITVEATDLPKRMPLGAPVVYRYRNGTEGVFYGGELRLDHRLGDAFSWWLGVGYVHGQDELYDEPAMGMPPLQTRLGLRGSALEGRLWGDLVATVAADQNRVAEVRYEIPTEGWATLDLRGGYRFHHGLEVLGGIDNVTDEDYTNHLNSLEPFTGQRVNEVGRSLHLGVRWSN